MTNRTQQITFIGLFIALCIIVPILFHFIGAGALFLPMFIPIILAGFLIDFPHAMIVGFAGPYLSSFITGMPPLFPMALIMSIEGLTATAIVSYFYHRKNVNFLICLILGIIAERVSLVLMGFVIAPLFKLPWEIFSIYKLTESMPGVLLQLILIPVILNMFWKFNLIPRKP